MRTINSSNIHYLVDYINSHYFEFYSGYPSIISEFFRLLKENDLSLNKPPTVIFTGAENT